MASKVAQHNYFQQVKRPNFKEKSLKILASEIVAQLKECKRRPSVCFCRYQHIDALNFDDFNFNDDKWLFLDPLVCFRKWCKVLYKVLHQDDMLRNPYLSWSNENLIASLKQRGITLPRPRNKAAYALALQGADAIRTFTFMDLPQEIRLMVYEEALRFDEEPYINKPSGLKPAIKPALLQICRQIREEATPIFYRINRFVLRFGRGDSVTSYRTLSWMRRYVGAADLEKLRYITLSRFHRHWSYHIRIDLNCRDPLKWTLHSRYHSRHSCSCKNYHLQPQEVTFMQARLPGRHCALVNPFQNASLVATNLAAAHKAIDKLWEECGGNGRIRPSCAGLFDFIQAIKEINMNLTKE
ncbi:hypothetical protein KCU78_g15595, partial [Aureobasidium melanogenum]